MKCNIKYTDIVFVAEADSLQSLPYYTFQLSLRYPRDHKRQRKEKQTNYLQITMSSSVIPVISIKEVVFYSALRSPG